MATVTCFDRESPVWAWDGCASSSPLPAELAGLLRGLGGPLPWRLPHLSSWVPLAVAWEFSQGAGPAPCAALTGPPGFTHSVAAGLLGQGFQMGNGSCQFLKTDSG